MVHLEKEIVVEIKDKKISGAVLEYVDMSEAVFRNIDLSLHWKTVLSSG